MKTERVFELDEIDISELKWNFPDSSFEKSSVNSFLKDHNNFLILAKEEGSITGVLRAHYLPRLDSKKASILLYEIDVHPEYRRKGIGAGMIEKLKEIARENKITEIWVITNKSNTAAMQLYKSTGATSKNDDDIVLEYYL